MATSPRRALGRWLEPFAASLWLFFLLWSAIVALVWTLGLGEAEVVSWTQHLLHLPPRETGTPLTGLTSALVSLLQWVDPIWVVLAAANIYSFTALREGLPTARRWSAIVLLAVSLMAWLSAKTGWPLGPIHYTSLLGPRLGALSVGMPLLWLSVLLGARDLALRLRPGLAQAPLAVGAALLVAAFDLALEPLAWKFRVFWLWYPARLPAPSWPPMQNYVTWFLASAGLVYLLREDRIAAPPPPAHCSSAAIYLIILGILILTHLARLGS